MGEEGGVVVMVLWWVGVEWWGWCRGGGGWSGGDGAVGGGGWSGGDGAVGGGGGGRISTFSSLFFLISNSTQIQHLFQYFPRH